MFAMPGMRIFSLSGEPRHGGVSCNQRGLFVGHVPLLKQECGSWAMRSITELNSELSSCYRLPIDIAAKTNALALIANALNRRDFAIAAIAAVHMQIPDPPSLAKGQENSDDIARRARELARSGLLKFWDPVKHPRAGTPPNAGWFAPVQGDSERPNVIPVSMADKKPRTFTDDDLPTGGGGGGGGNPFSAGPKQELIAPSEPTEPSTGAEPDQILPFPGGLPLQLAPYEPGGKTYGIFQPSTGDLIALESGSQGPAANMPPGSLGFDAVTKLHVEGQAAALMWQQGIEDATLSINNPEICDSCVSLLPRMLPPGATLRVILPNGTVTEFKGIPR